MHHFCNWLNKIRNVYEVRHQNSWKCLMESNFILLFLLLEFVMKISMFLEHFNKNSIFSSQKVFLDLIFFNQIYSWLKMIQVEGQARSGAKHWEYTGIFPCGHSNLVHNQMYFFLLSVCSLALCLVWFVIFFYMSSVFVFLRVQRNRCKKQRKLIQNHFYGNPI